MSSSNKIITKSSGKIIQMRKTTKNSIEKEKALRDQLHIEIENKTKACSNPTYNCSIPRLEGYEYCIRHILLDPRAPYKQCAYIYPTNGKKCTQAAPKHDNKKDSAVTTALTNYCFEHSRLIQLDKTHEIIGQYKHIETNEAYLNNLTHHIKIDRQDSPPPSHLDTDEEIDVVSSNTEPFINYVHVAKFDSKNENKGKRRILDYASDSSTDDENPTIDNAWKGYEWDNSDAESVDSQNEDFLKHAGIYTTEEATMIAKQKMMRLQTLYVEQIQRLQHLLKEKRRKYLQSIRKERETLCSIHDQPKDTSEERKLYEKLKALNHYHKRHGIEAVLQKKYQERRIKANDGSGPSHKGPLYTKCIFTEGGVKCGERALPCCKYCKKHILEDKKQILFRACGVEKSGIVCQEPVPNIFEDATCVLHINFPTQKTYTQKKFESETEEEDDDAVNGGGHKKIIKMETKINDEINPNNTNIYNTIDVNYENSSSNNNINKRKLEETPSILKILKKEEEEHNQDNNHNKNNDDDKKDELSKNDDETDNNVTIVHDSQSQEMTAVTCKGADDMKLEKDSVVLFSITDSIADFNNDQEQQECEQKQQQIQTEEQDLKENSDNEITKNSEEILLEIIVNNKE